jgi:hypothetical protein
MIRDNGMAGIDRANNPGFKGTFVKTGVSTDDLGKDDYLKVLAATVVNGFVEKSQDLTPKQKNDAKTSVESNVTPILNTNKEWAKLYRTCNDTQKIADAKNPTFNKGWQNTTKQVLLGAITIPGIIGSIKAMFRPKDDGTKKGFWEQVGNLAKVAGFAFVAYNMVYHKRGVHETIDNTRQTIGQWTGMVNNRRDAAKGLEFGKPVGVPSL